MTGRRDFLRLLGAGAAAGATGLLPSRLEALAQGAFAEPGRRGPIGPAPLIALGVQLYMLRGPMRTEPDRTLERIAALGYREVEWWGTWGLTPREIRARLDAHGLTSPAAHVDPRDLAPDRLDALLDAAATIGHRTVLVAWTPPEMRRTADDWKRTGDLLSAAGARGTARGIRAGYHNHDFEFERPAGGRGRSALELLLDATDRATVDLELDCYWAFRAGADPVALLATHRDRITLLHLKDSSGAPEHAQRDLGEGVIDWAAVLRAAVAGRVTNVFVEHDAPRDPWETARRGREHLRRLGY
jgi:sugar phosphate isomerase/epimerase